jgi:hypothetical protein
VISNRLSSCTGYGDEFGLQLEAATGNFDLHRGVDFWRCDLMRWGFDFAAELLAAQQLLETVCDVLLGTLYTD